MTRARIHGALILLSLLAAGGCTGQVTTLAGSGHCLPDDNIVCNTDFNGFTCTGGARPDQNASFGVGVIEGTVCTALGSIDTSGGLSYCCTSATTACGYDPSMVCGAGTYGYACTPPSRPENFDPDLSCGMGQPLNGETVFCCGTATMLSCSADSAIACPADLKPLECLTADLPNEGELGTDQSRSDATLLCDVPSIVGGRYGYCCFTPTQLTLGGTCLQDQAVPNCASGSFGFACTGPDTPEQDYPRIMCSTPSLPGTSAQGYRANLYCCDYLSLGE